MTLAEFVAVIKPTVDRGAVAKVESQMAGIGRSVSSFFGGIGANIGKLISSALGPLAIVMAALDFGKQIFGAALLGDSLQKAGQRVQATAQQMQAMQQFAAEADVENGALELSLRRLNVALAKAAQGSKVFQNVLPGNWWQDQQGNTLSAYEAFRKLSDIFKTMPDGANKALIATMLLGKTGQPLLQAMNKGAAGLDFISEKLAWYGVNVKDGGDASAKLDDSLKELSMAWQGLKNAVASGPFTRILTAMVWRLTAAIQALGDMLDNFRTKANDAARAAFVAFFAATLPLLSVFIYRSLAAIALWAGLAGFQGGGFLAFLGFAAARAKVFALSSLAAIWPWALAAGVIILAGLAIEDLLTFMRGGESVFGDFANYLQGTWVQSILDVFWSLLEPLFKLWDLIQSPLDPTAWKNFFMSLVGIVTTAFKALLDMPIVGDVLKGMASVVSSPTKKAPSQAIVPSAAQLARVNPASLQPNFSASVPASVAGAAPVSNSTQVNMTINPSAGMDEKALADHTAKKIQEYQSIERKQAYSGMRTAT